MRNVKLALVAVLALGLLSLVRVQAEPAAPLQGAAPAVRSAT
ncbi:hypothetical protein [Ideonella alba]|nr:hypothetical protein [Ideonella alba]